MSAHAIDALFPLPLTPFEKYMLADDRPDYPMTFSLQLDFSGEFRRPLFDASLEEALSRHPLLCAVVRHLPKAGRVWMPADPSMPPVDWNVAEIPLACPHGEAIDLQRETGLRIWVRQGHGAAHDRAVSPRLLRRAPRLALLRRHVGGVCLADCAAAPGCRFRRSIRRVCCGEASAWRDAPSRWAGCARHG